MKANLRDSILIGAALITILACGFGLGRLSPREINTAPTVPVNSLTQETLSALRSSLDLTPEQESEIAKELDSFSLSVLDSREKALIQYYQSLLNFHDKIAPKLNPRQREILEANRKLLKKEYSTRFPIQS